MRWWLDPTIPIKILHELVAGATKAVRARLLKVASPEMRETIEAAIESIATQESAKAPEPIDYSEAKSSVLALSLAGKLSDSAVNRFAVHGQRATCGSGIIRSLGHGDRCHRAIDGRERLLRTGRGLPGLPAELADHVSGHQQPRPHPGLSQQELEQGKELFESLSLSVAQRTIRFGSVRELVKPGLTDNDFAAARAS